MAVPVVATSAFTTDGANTTSRTVANPTGTVSGNGLLLLCSVDGASAITPPAGFTLEFERVNDAGTACIGVYSRLADGSEGSTFTIGTASEQGQFFMLRITGVPSAAFVDVISHATGDDAVVPSLPCFAESDDSLILRFAGADGGVGLTDPASHTAILNKTGTTSGTAASVCSLDQASAGYCAFAAFSQLAEQYNCATIVIRSTLTLATPPVQPYIACMNFTQPPATVALDYPKPYGTVDGELLVLIQEADVTAVISNPGSAFTSIQDTSNSTIWGHALYRIASSEGASYTGSNTTSSAKQGVLMRIINAHATTPINTSSVATGADAAPTASTITPSVNNCLLLAAQVSDDDDVTTDTGYPTGYTGVLALDTTQGADVGMIVAHEEQTTAAATGSVAMALAAIEEWIAFNIAIAPAVAAGISFDAASNSGYQSAVSTYNWSHTCAGSDRYLVVGVAMLSLAQTVTGITYNSVAMTLIGTQASISGACRIELWGLTAPSTGSNSIAVTLSGAIASAACASSYAGVHQTSPIEAYNSAQATNVGAADATVNVTTVADNDWVVDIVASDDTAITVGAGQTQRANVTGAGGSGAMSSEGPKTPAGSVTMSWTNVAALATWAIGGVALRPVAADSLLTFVPKVIWL